ncbi:MAG TPA: SRPBCC family protein [Flavobacteriales bacterium]
MARKRITVETLVGVSPQKAWDYYHNPKHITQWNFASKDWHCPYAENNLTVGGKYLARMEARDGSFGFDYEAIYNSIDEFKGFTYTMPDGRRVDTSFEEVNGSTKVTTVFDAEHENSAEMQRVGWQSILDNYKRYAESQG